MFDIIPKRYVLSIVALSATTLSIALQTNLSLAIVYMVKTAHDETSLVSTANECSSFRNLTANFSSPLKMSTGELNWSPEIQGITISLQFLGMILGYIPGGRLGELYGAKITLIITMFVASVFTILSPIAANISVYVFIACRILVGLGASPVFPVLIVMISKWIPDSEQSFIASIMLAGYGTGASVSYLTAGILCSSNFLGGWPSVFYLSGLTGIAFCFLCFFTIHETPHMHPTITLIELEYLQNNIGPLPKEMKSIPWRSMATSVPVWALAIGTFGQYWLLAFFVTSHSMYMGTILHLDSTQNGILSCVPNFLRAIFSCLIASIIDMVRRRKDMPIVYIRKGVTLCNSIVSILGFTGVLFSGCDPYLNTVAFILGSLCGDFAIFGVGLAPADIAPNLRGTLAGILCSFGSAPYVLLPAMIGLFTKEEQSMRQWNYIYYFTIAVTIVTTLIYVSFGTSDPQTWGTVNGILSEKTELRKDQKKQENIGNNSTAHVWTCSK